MLYHLLFHSPIVNCAWKGTVSLPVSCCFCFIRARSIICGLSSVISFSNHRASLERYRVSPQFDNSLLSQIPQYTSFTSPPSKKKLHRHCFRFLLGHLHVPREIEYNHIAKFWGVNTMYYGICESRNRELKLPRR